MEGKHKICSFTWITSKDSCSNFCPALSGSTLFTKISTMWLIDRFVVVSWGPINAFLGHICNYLLIFVSCYSRSVSVYLFMKFSNLYKVGTAIESNIPAELAKLNVRFGQAFERECSVVSLKCIQILAPSLLGVPGAVRARPTSQGIYIEEVIN